MNRKIIITADSTAMPRPGLPYEKTWIYMLKESMPGYDIMDRSARGSTAFRLAAEGGGGFDLLETYSPAAAIVQVGMNDCAPRLFDKRSLEFRAVSRYMPPAIRDRYIARVKRVRGRNPEITETSPEDFERYIDGYCGRAQSTGCGIVLIKIMAANSLMRSKSPRCSDNILKYNSIIEKIAKGCRLAETADPLNSESEIDNLTLDETHPNEAGHIKIFLSVKDALDRLSGG
jgi:lysophospholipase L1-like esterase